MVVTRKKKEIVLEDLVKKFEKAKIVIFSKYAGINVHETSIMRKNLRAQGIDYKVAKKTLVQMAAKKIGLEPMSDEIMEGPISVTFGYNDEVAPAKILDKYAKDHEGFAMMGGYMNGKILLKTAIKELAKIPSKEELLGKFVGMLTSPIRNFASAINSPMSSFARALQQYGEKHLSQKS